MIDPDTLAMREAFLVYLEEVTGLPRASVELLDRGDRRRGEAFAAGYAAGVAAVDELLAALRAEPYFHGVWAWREHLEEGQLGYVRTGATDRVLRAFAALGDSPATEPRVEPS